MLDQEQHWLGQVMDLPPLAIIPARLGSQRIPHKVLQPVGGKSLLQWAIEGAQDSGVFQRIWVSSESEQIGELAQSFGAWWIPREERLASSSATIMDVLHSLDITQSEAIYMLLPTCPFRTGATIRRAWKTFRGRPDAQGLISLAPWSYTPYWSLWVQGDWVAPLFPGKVGTPRQALPPIYRHDGAHYILRASALENPLRWILPFYTPEGEVCDIDTPEDLAYAQYLYQQRQDRG